MRTLFGALALSLAITVPAVAAAQTSNAPVTRAEVRSELVQLKNAGYKPSRTQYPADIQAAEARIAAQYPTASNNMAGNNAASNNTTSNNTAAYGGTNAGTSEAGHPVPNATWPSPYLHH
jgi:hypothetical protein